MPSSEVKELSQQAHLQQGDFLLREEHDADHQVHAGLILSFKAFNDHKRKGKLIPFLLRH